MMSRSVVLVIVRAAGNAVLSWLHSCGEACGHSTAAIPKALGSCFLGLRGACLHSLTFVKTRLARCRRTYPLEESQVPLDAESGQGGGSIDGREFVVIEFNAWECAGLEVLWAVVTAKIFDAVSDTLQACCICFFRSLPSIL